MLDVGITSLVISPEAAKALSIPVIRRPWPIKSGDVSGNTLQTENLFTVPLGISFGNYSSYDEEHDAFQGMKTSGDYDPLIPVLYLEKHKARRTKTSHLHFPPCQSDWYNFGKIHPEYAVTDDKRIALSNKSIHIGAVVWSNPYLAWKLPTQYHEFLLLVNPTEAEKSPDEKECDHRIELLGPDDTL
jgi:hypothetical protein